MAIVIGETSMFLSDPLSLICPAVEGSPMVQWTNGEGEGAREGEGERKRQRGGEEEAA
jgi:hypothetical protein